MLVRAWVSTPTIFVYCSRTAVMAVVSFPRRDAEWPAGVGSQRDTSLTSHIPQESEDGQPSIRPPREPELAPRTGWTSRREDTALAGQITAESHPVQGSHSGSQPQACHYTLEITAHPKSRCLIVSRPHQHWADQFSLSVRTVWSLVGPACQVVTLRAGSPNRVRAPR